MIYITPVVYESIGVCVGLQSPSNPRFYRQIVSYWMTVDDHGFA